VDVNGAATAPVVALLKTPLLAVLLLSAMEKLLWLWKEIPVPAEFATA